MSEELVVIGRKPSPRQLWAREVQAIRELERVLGGRMALIDALQHATPTRESDFVLGLIADPGNDDVPLTTLCEEAGIRVATLLALFKESELTRAQIIAIRKLGQALPDVTDDFLRRAVEHTVTCPECDGVVPMDFGDGADVGPVCEGCHGRGVVTKQPELARQKLVLEMGGLVNTGPGLQVNVNNQQTHQMLVVDTAFTQFMRASDQVLDARRVVRGPVAVTREGDG